MSLSVLRCLTMQQAGFLWNNGSVCLTLPFPVGIFLYDSGVLEGGRELAGDLTLRIKKKNLFQVILVLKYTGQKEGTCNLDR